MLDRALEKAERPRIPDYDLPRGRPQTYDQQRQIFQ